MAYYNINLKAGLPFRQGTSGQIILVDTLGAANGVDITPVAGGRELTKMPNRKAAFKYNEAFEAVIFQAAVDCTIGVFLTFADVNLGFSDGAAVSVQGAVSIANDAAHRVPVDIGGGTVNVTAGAVTVGNTNATAVPVQNQQLAAIVDHAVASINTGAGQLLIADATLKRLRIRNNSATAVLALGGAAMTFANAAIFVQPGDTFFEDDAAGASWYATSDTNATDVRVMGLK